jgi:hypothetical protein
MYPIYNCAWFICVCVCLCVNLGLFDPKEKNCLECLKKWRWGECFDPERKGGCRNCIVRRFLIFTHQFCVKCIYQEGWDEQAWLVDEKGKRALVAHWRHWEVDIKKLGNGSLCYYPFYSWIIQIRIVTTFSRGMEIVFRSTTDSGSGLLPLLIS